MPKILLLEDDLDLQETIAEELQEHGFDVLACTTSDDAIDASFDTAFDLYLLDVNVPGVNGYEFLAQLRDAGDATRAIFLTSMAQTGDIAKGFDAGADDYITKPFDFEELLIRIRRFFKKPACVKLTPTVTFNPQTLKIEGETFRNTLHSQEAKVLSYFIENPNRIVSKEEVIDAVFEEPITDSTFRVYIKNIKKACNGEEVLKNIRAQGYLFETV